MFIMKMCCAQVHMKSQKSIITGYYGRLLLMIRGQLTDQSLNSLFTKITTICETVISIR